MNKNIIKHRVQIDGREITCECGYHARLENGALVILSGEQDEKGIEYDQNPHIREQVEAMLRRQGE